MSDNKLDEDGQSIRKLPQLNNKIVRYIYPDDDGNFFLIASHDYDKSFDVIYSETSKFPVVFSCKIEPNIINVHDMDIQIEEHSEFCSVRVASSRDGGFQIDWA